MKAAITSGVFGIDISDILFFYTYDSENTPYVHIQFKDGTAHRLVDVSQQISKFLAYKFNSMGT